MMKSMTILSSLLTAFLLLSSCEEKENTTPETPTETNYDLLEFEGKAEPLDCGRNLVKRFIEIPQSNWGRIDAGKQPSSFVTYPDVCAYLGAFWFLEAAIENADLTGDEEARQKAMDLMQGMVDKYDDVIDGRTTYTTSSGEVLPVITDLLWRHESNRVDYYIFGAISLHIASIMENPAYSGIEWKQTREEYLEFGLEYADNQFHPYTRDEFDARFNSPEYNKTNTLFKMSTDDYNRWKGYMDQGYSWQTRLWIDDMFMITALQMQAYEATKDDPSYIGDNFSYADASSNINNSQNRYLDRAVREMKLYIEELQGEDGLYWHSPEAPFFWARGNGWMAVGMPLMLRLIEDIPEYAAEAGLLREEYETMMVSLLKYQLPTGMWAQLVDKSNYWPETSGSAMFAYAFITGVRNGWLDEKTYGAAARKAWTSLMEYMNPNYDIREVCEGTGTGSTADHYYKRKCYTGDTHGQAAMMWCAWGLTEIANDAAAGEKGAAVTD